MRDHLGADAEPYRDDVFRRSRERAERTRDALLKAEREASRKEVWRRAVWAAAIGTAVSIAGIGLAVISLPRIWTKDPILGMIGCCGAVFIAPLMIAAGLMFIWYSLSFFDEYYKDGSHCSGSDF
jgi:hypothetical protein